MQPESCVIHIDGASRLTEKPKLQSKKIRCNKSGKEGGHKCNQRRLGGGHRRNGEGCTVQCTRCMYCKVKIEATKEDCKIIQFHLKYRLGDATKDFKFKQKDKSEM
jgi:hypothetical protein